MKKKINAAMLTIMFTIMFLLLSLPAHAYLILVLDDPSTVLTDVIIVDDVDGGLNIPTAMGISNVTDYLTGDGLIGYNSAINGSVGGFSVNITTGVSKPVIGNPYQAKIDLNTVTVSGAAGTLNIWLTDTDFGPLPGQDTSGIYLTNLWGGTTDGQVSAQGYLDPSNQNFGTAFTTGLQGPFGPGAFSNTISASIDPFAGNFSLTEWMSITHDSARDVTSFDKELVAAVPEPATMLLLGTGLVGIAGWRRRKMPKQV